MKKLLTSAAFVALLAAAPAVAKDTTAAPATPPAATDAANPATPANPDLLNPANPPAASDQSAAPLPNAEPTAPATAETPAATNPAKPPAAVAAAPGSFIGQQAAEEQLASNWIGQSIYNSADENLGDVNDLVIGKDGKVDAIVIGVGGFLGIGEKNVAVPFGAITVSTDANGKLKLMLQATKEQLDAAPEFMTLAELRAQKAPATDVTPMAPAAPAP